MSSRFTTSPKSSVRPPLTTNARRKLSIRRSQNTLQANRQQIANQMCADVLRSPADVFLLEMGHLLADSGFDLSKSLHEGSPSLSSEQSRDAMRKT